MNTGIFLANFIVFDSVFFFPLFNSLTSILSGARTFASSNAFSSLMQPWLKNRRSLLKDDCKFVECRYMLKGLCKLNFTTPKELPDPVAWRNSRGSCFYYSFSISIPTHPQHFLLRPPTHNHLYPGNLRFFVP